jgi:hypothetical protein
MSFHHDGVWFVFYSDGLCVIYSRSLDNAPLGKPLVVILSLCRDAPP